MKKITTRLAICGGVLLLAVCAIILAQNDARQHLWEQPTLAPLAAEEAVPIPASESDDGWNPASRALVGRMVVRGNNESGAEQSAAEEYATDEVAEDAAEDAAEDFAAGNPLRLASGRSDQPSQVVLAAAGAAVAPEDGLAPAVAIPPAWLGGGPLPSAASSNGPSSNGPQTALKAEGATGEPTGEQSAAGPTVAAPVLPSLPSFPMGGASSSATAVQSLSDTQRPPMPATNLATPATLPSIPASPFGAAAAASSAVPAESPTASPAPSSLPTASPMQAAASLPAVSPAPAPAPVASSAPAAGSTQLVSNQPGNRYLDGSQNPSLMIQKRAPEEIQVGKPATFVIAVRNAGNATAHDVRVVDSVPQGARFVSSVPPATPNPQGILSWSLGAMSAGDERTVTLQLVPEVQGEVGSNAVVYFAAQASVRTVATLPKLELQVQSLPEMLIGGRQSLSVVVKNSGTGMARDVRLEVDLPESLKHDIGESQLTAPLGDLRPNDVRPITLELAAVTAGQAGLAFRAVNDDGTLAERQVAIEIQSPNLTARIAGPTLRYLDRQATLVIHVGNNGTTAATNVDFVAHLPPGMRYVDSTQKGYYDVSTHSVKWGLYELPVQTAEPIELTLLPVELGPQQISFLASADLGLKAEAKHTVTVEGLAELAFTLGQDRRTIETGATATYYVQITNVGNKPDRDVSLSIALPAGAVLKDVHAQVKHRVEGNTLVFEPVAEMRNKDQHTFRFEVQHTQPGTQIIRSQLTSANWPVAVIKEEGTLVYDDQG